MEEEPEGDIIPRALGARRGRQGQSAAARMQQDGPLALVAVVADAQGRWSAELSRRGRGAVVEQARRALEGERPFCQWPEAPPGTFRIVGFALMRAWRFVSARASGQGAFALMQLAQVSRRRCAGVGFLEHPVIASARLVDSQTMPLKMMDRLSGALSQAAVDIAKVGQVTETTPAALGGQETRGKLAELCPQFARVLGQWQEQHGQFDAGHCIAWPVAPEVASAIVTGTLREEVSMLVRRDNARVAAPPLAPPPRLRRAFMKVDRAFPQAPAGQEGGDGHCRFRGHPYDRVVGALRATRHQAAISLTDAATRDYLKYLLPDTWEQVLQSRQDAGIEHPSRYCIARARARLDIAAMLARRSWYAANGPTYRYLGFDASPQRPGIEVFATIERVVSRDAMSGLDIATKVWSPPVEVRLLPLTVLGQGKAGLTDKVTAHVHQCWLEYGPDRRQLRAANLDVRQCMSDMGTEFGIADAGDIVDGYLDGKCTAGGDVGFLYPLALAVPGPQHILDNALKAAFPKLPWWTSWQAEAKAVCHWLHSRANREFVQHALLQINRGDRDLLVATLKHSVPPFAHWRWGTVTAVTRGLARVEQAVRIAVTPAVIASVRWRDGPEARAFALAVGSDAFWGRARALRALAAPVSTFSGWLKGCSCHEELLLQGKKFECPWKSARTRLISGRLGELYAEIRNPPMMEGQVPPEYAGVLALELDNARSFLLAQLILKFAWVNEVPYLIWQARTLPEPWAGMFRVTCA